MSIPEGGNGEVCVTLAILTMGDLECDVNVSLTIVNSTKAGQFCIPTIVCFNVCAVNSTLKGVNMYGRTREYCENVCLRSKLNCIMLFIK